MIQRERHGSVAVLRMAHGKANALDLEFCEGLREALASERPVKGAKGNTNAARAIVLTGQGGIFSAGVDLPRLLSGGPEYLASFLPALSATLLELITHPLPVVAAINGHAIAGGCVIACATDRRWMTDGSGGRALFGSPELSVGVPFPQLALGAMSLAAGREALVELVLGGTLWKPDEALRRGLVHALVPPSELESAALAEAERLASIPARSLRTTKRALNRAVLARWESHGAADEAETLAIWSSAEVQASIRAFVERTLGA